MERRAIANRGGRQGLATWTPSTRGAGHCCTPTPLTTWTDVTSNSTVSSTALPVGATAPNCSDWDTAASPCGLLFPQRASDMIQSLVGAEQSGAYPRWALANSATGMMSAVWCRSSVKPHRLRRQGFDLKSALPPMVNAAGRVGLDGFLERPGIAAI